MTRAKNIFLVEDDEDDNKFFVEALKEIDDSLSLKRAQNGAEALTQLNKMEPLPDLIFMDINTPFMNGFDCLIQLKKQTRFEKIPVVILTTSNNPVEAEHALVLGASFFLKKPSCFSSIKKNLIDMLNFRFTQIIMDQRKN